MEFDSSYNLHCQLRLPSGRSITLDKLMQCRTYAGLMEGAPNKRSNDLSIEWALDRQLPDSVGNPLLIEPNRRDYHAEPGDMEPVLARQHDREPVLVHIPEWLPEVECTGIFSSIRPARDNNMDASSLTILWYQDEFGIDQSAMHRIITIDWDKRASDWKY